MICLLINFTMVFINLHVFLLPVKIYTIYHGFLWIYVGIKLYDICFYSCFPWAVKLLWCPVRLRNIELRKKMGCVSYTFMKQAISIFLELELTEVA